MPREGLWADQPCTCPRQITVIIHVWPLAQSETRGKCLGRAHTAPWKSVGPLGGSWDSGSCPTCHVTRNKPPPHHASPFSLLRTQGIGGSSLRVIQVCCVSLWLVSDSCPSSPPTQVPSLRQLHLLREESGSPAVSLPLAGADMGRASQKSQTWVQKSCSCSSLAGIPGD